MKKIFTSGLALLLPIILTVMIVNFLINFVTQPFLNSTQAFLETLPFFQHPVPLFHQATLLALSTKGLIILCLIGFTMLVGLFGKYFFIDVFFLVGDQVLDRLPFINKIYKACKDIVHSLFSSSSKKFSRVVFVPFPSPNNLSLGLVASESIEIKNCPHETENFLSVFVPGTPNPSVGLLLMFKREQVIFVDMKVEEAMKFIVSCGIVMPNTYQPHENHEKQFFDQDYLLSGKGQFSEDPADLHKSAGSF